MQKVKVTPFHSAQRLHVCVLHFLGILPLYGKRDGSETNSKVMMKMLHGGFFALLSNSSHEF